MIAIEDSTEHSKISDHQKHEGNPKNFTSSEGGKKPASDIRPGYTGHPKCFVTRDLIALHQQENKNCEDEPKSQERDRDGKVWPDGIGTSQCRRLYGNQCLYAGPKKSVLVQTECVLGFLVIVHSSFVGGHYWGFPDERVRRYLTKYKWNSLPTLENWRIVAIRLIHVLAQDRFGPRPAPNVNQTEHPATSR